MVENDGEPNADEKNSNDLRNEPQEEVKRVTFNFPEESDEVNNINMYLNLFLYIFPQFYRIQETFRMSQQIKKILLIRKLSNTNFMQHKVNSSAK